MFRNSSIVKGLSKKMLVCLLLVSTGALTFASMGGGDAKKSKTVKADFTPIRTTNGFTLKSGPSYRGSMAFGQQKTDDAVSFNALITYQKGNTTYILPYKYKLQTSMESKSNLQLLNLRVKMHK